MGWVQHNKINLGLLFIKKVLLLFFDRIQMKRVIYTFLVFLCFNVSSYAKYRQVCDVQYQNKTGIPKSYKVEVTFLSGFELNEATKTQNYEFNSNYAVIFWGEGQATIIKISTFLGCGIIIDKICITLFDTLSGKDKDGVEWKICTSGFCIL
jgi:hypothetical protein